MSKLIAVLLAGLCASAAMARPHHDNVTTVLPGVNIVVNDRDHDRWHNDWRQDRHADYRGGRGCPPGLAKKHNGCMPPGLAKKFDRRDEHYGRRDGHHDRYARDDWRRRDHVAYGW